MLLQSEPASDRMCLPSGTLYGAVQYAIDELGAESIGPRPFGDAYALGYELGLHLLEIVVHDIHQVGLVHKVWSRVHKMSTPSNKPGAYQGDVTPDQDAGRVLDRFKDALNMGTDADLASVLGVSKSTLSNWRSRNSIPLSKIRFACKKYGVPMDYLLTGNLISDRNTSAILDADLLGYIFRILHRYGFLSLPETRDPDYDPAIRVAAEFLELQSQTRQLMEQLLAEGRLDREGATREIIERLKSKGPQ